MTFLQRIECCFARVLVLTVVVAVGPAGCAKKPVAVALPPPSPLEVPVPPPRILAPVAAPEAPPPEPEPAPETAKTSRGRAGSKPGAPQEARPEAPKETPPTEAAPAAPAESPKTPEATTEPGLRTTQTANDSETERRVREGLARARRDLQTVNRASLSTDARAQFDTANRFIDQAGDALAVRNFMFAAYLADKAQALARGLASR